ncbi:hypothetical protein QFZ25_001897 [Bacillus atrophaeus]|nr:hypothetical protein [Bacillus atrophaeus]
MLNAGSFFIQLFNYFNNFQYSTCVKMERVLYDNKKPERIVIIGGKCKLK